MVSENLLRSIARAHSSWTTSLADGERKLDNLATEGSWIVVSASQH